MDQSAVQSLSQNINVSLAISKTAVGDRMHGVPSVIHSIGGVLQNQIHLHQLFFGLWVGVLLTHSRRSPRYLWQATSTAQDGARDNSCYMTS